MTSKIEIDSGLLKETIEATGLSTEREVVEFALRELLKMPLQARLRWFRGRIAWEGDLNEMRRNRFSERS